MTRREFLSATAGTAAALSLPRIASAYPMGPKPNVILIMTDDQGYGDIACLGNKIIKTPNMDKLHKQSVRLTNFHVDPTCSPTRSALMTGHYSTRTGVWHTIMGRSLLGKHETTVADIFKANGYATGAFGKWHLGDNYPFRAQDRGFSQVLMHGGGGVGQTPDFWGNTYFDDTYWLNGVPTKYKGYCTDVFFDGALEFIEKNKEKPFFCYLPTNAAHGPFNVAEKYSKPYLAQGVPANRAKFWGMVTNIDENLGKMMAKLDEWDLSRDTILIFMTDNGTAAGAGKNGGFNGGMKGAKGSEYEGGHRVPFFIRWPGKFKPGVDVDHVTAHIDVLPTLIDLCGLKKPAGLEFDGASLVPLLAGEKEWPDRTLFVHSQRIDHVQKWRKCAVMTDRWRYINGKELYDMKADPGQARNVVAEHPQVAAKLRAAYEEWWKSLSVQFDKYCEIIIGNDAEPESRITCHDWHGPSVPWNQGHIRGTKSWWNGFWAVEIERAGRYEFKLRRWPKEVDKPIPADTARLKIGGVDETKPVKAGAREVVFQLDLKAGKTKLETWLTDKKLGKSRGAYFVYVKRI